MENIDKKRYYRIELPYIRPTTPWVLQKNCLANAFRPGLSRRMPPQENRSVDEPASWVYIQKSGPVRADNTPRPWGNPPVG
jgi:hypothetical protein